MAAPIPVPRAHRRYRIHSAFLTRGGGGGRGPRWVETADKAMHRRPSTMWEQPSSCPRLPRRRKMMQLLAGAGLIAFVVSLALHQDQAGSRPLYIDGGHWATDHGALRLEEAEALRPLAAACIERGMWLEYTTKTQPSKLKYTGTRRRIGRGRRGWRWMGSTWPMDSRRDLAAKACEWPAGLRPTACR